MSRAASCVRASRESCKLRRVTLNVAPGNPAPQKGQGSPAAALESEPPHEDPGLLEAREVVPKLGSDAERGLSAAEAAARLARFGANELAAAAAIPAWRKLVRQLNDPLVYLLL